MYFCSVEMQKHSYRIASPPVLDWRLPHIEHLSKGCRIWKPKIITNTIVLVILILKEPKSLF